MKVQCEKGGPDQRNGILREERDYSLGEPEEKPTVGLEQNEHNGETEHFPDEKVDQALSSSLRISDLS